MHNNLHRIAAATFPTKRKALKFHKKLKKSIEYLLGFLKIMSDKEFKKIFQLLASKCSKKELSTNEALQYIASSNLKWWTNTIN